MRCTFLQKTKIHSVFNLRMFSPEILTFETSSQASRVWKWAICLTWAKRVANSWSGAFLREPLTRDSRSLWARLVPSVSVTGIPAVNRSHSPLMSSCEFSFITEPELVIFRECQRHILIHGSCDTSSSPLRSDRVCRNHNGLTQSHKA